MTAITVRRAEAADAATIAGYNAAMALATEHKVLIPEILGAGVRRLIESPALGFYAVAQHKGSVIGCLMVTQEWSDWRNGLFWWIQSVYVQPEFRRKGVYRQLYEFVKSAAARETGICGFRLYVEKDNVVAQETYRALGMEATDYLVFEELKPGVRYFTRPGG